MAEMCSQVDGPRFGEGSSKATCILKFGDVPEAFRMEAPRRHLTETVTALCTMEADHAYLAEGPDNFLDICDMVLTLEDKSELPAHSQVLARCSHVFSAMLIKEGPVYNASAANKVRVPLSDCSKEIAVIFLSAIYSGKPSRHIDIETAMSVARQGHKYGLKVVPHLRPGIMTS